MADRDFSEQLNGVVESILQRQELEEFQAYWELAREVLVGVAVRRFYVSAGPEDANVAIITDTLLVDIEGDEEGSEEGEEPSGNLSVYRLDAISGVEFVEGPVEDVPDSEGAQLVLLAYVAGSEIVELHWTAHTDEEREYLVLFGKTLVDSIAGI